MKIKREFKGNLGVFLVCAELSKRNLIAMPTSRNTKGYDVIALNPDTNISIGIQVKCSDKGEFPILTSHWSNYKEKIKEKIISPYIFVDISNLEKPNYYILTKEEMKNLMIERIESYIRKYQEKHNTTFEEMLKMEKETKRKPDVHVIKLKDIENYKDKWNSIIDLLRG